MTGWEKRGYNRGKRKKRRKAGEAGLSRYYVKGGNVYNTDRISTEFLAVNVCGYHAIDDKQDFTTLREHGRRDYQLIYIVSGLVSYETPEGKIQEGGEGTVLLYRPGQKQLYTYHAAKHSQGYWIHFSGTGAEMLLTEAGLAGKQNVFIGKSPECEALFNSILQEFETRHAGHELMICARLAELIATVGRRFSATREKNETGKYQHLEAVIARMNAEYAKDHSIAEYAAMCAVTEPHFIHLFREYTGLAPYAYVIRIRMERARDLLSSSTLGVGEIGRMVGYENSLYFSRVFRAQTGYSPTDYRKISAY